MALESEREDAKSKQELARNAAEYAARVDMDKVLSNDLQVVDVETGQGLVFRELFTNEEGQDQAITAVMLRHFA